MAAALVATVAAAIAAVPVAAHGPTHATGHAPLTAVLGGLLLVAGTALVALGVYADRALDVHRSYVDAGVVAGVLLVAASLLAFWL